MYSQQSIDELKSLIRIRDVISEFIPLKLHSGNHEGLCPFHDEKTPSFKVSESKNIYKCFGCGKSGDAIQFVMEYQGIPFYDAVKYLADKYNIILESDKPKEYKIPAARIGRLRDKTYGYFASRGISKQTVDYFNITEAIEWLPAEGAEVPVICFNYYRAGELINIKFRSAKKGFKLEKGAELVFYNIDAIVNSETCIIVEGEFDCLSVYEAGYSNVISVPNGASAKAMEYLDSAADALSCMKQFTIMTDNDVPGRQLKEELARRLGYERCLQVVYPSGCKDANDVLIKHGKDELRKCIKDAVEFPLQGIATAFDEIDAVIDIYDNGYPNGFKVELPGIDRETELQLMAGQFTTVTGVPGSGKSEWCDWLMVSMSMNHGWKWAVYSAENQPVSMHITKLAEKFAGKAFGFRKDISHRLSRQQLSDALYFIQNHFYFIKIEDTEPTIKNVFDKVDELVLRKGVNAFILDPFNKIEQNYEPGMNETQSTNKSLSFVSSFCKRKQIHTIIIAHPTKMPKLGKKNFEVPTMYNISGSANWYNQTDNGIVVYRDREKELVEVHVQKVRYSWLGKEGVAVYRYNTFTRQYEVYDEISTNDPPPF